jgi:hypothetical protein
MASSARFSTLLLFADPSSHRSGVGSQAGLSSLGELLGSVGPVILASDRSVRSGPELGEVVGAGPRGPRGGPEVTEVTEVYGDSPILAKATRGPLTLDLPKQGPHVTGKAS